MPDKSRTLPIEVVRATRLYFAATQDTIEPNKQQKIITKAKKYDDTSTNQR
ncbi:hypothetical protein [Microcoleus sp. bin38.metabat.b11b12b14.051]|uniref:hypothetical protein n=1 Tax=Microcoleus sp. bin38.metabat.b11b12b14.051 TaxID=2742709 RepID=UPI0025E06E96|nr:hypothetical protein [Microcoleus sp. bin38.metabat.b11b12b14.051]